MKTQKSTDCNGHPYVTRGSYRTADGKAQIDWTLARRADGQHLFSASGTCPGSAGQCLDSIAATYPDDATVQEIAKVWAVYHLNDMKAGTPEQETFLTAHSDGLASILAAKREHTPGASHYDAACELLANANLLHFVSDAQRAECAAAVAAFRARYPWIKRPTAEIVKHLGCSPKPYTYGSAWLTLPIPPAVVEQIKGWVKLDNTAGESGYEASARTFLERNGLTMRITLSDSKPAPWESSGHHYRITISRKGAPGKLAFDFWGSKADADAKTDPTPYGVLSCLSSDASVPETITEWFAEFGGDPDSIRERQIAARAVRFGKTLRAFFTPAELAELSEIG